MFLCLETVLHCYRGIKLAQRCLTCLIRGLSKSLLHRPLSGLFAGPAADWSRDSRRPKSADLVSCRGRPHDVFKVVFVKALTLQFLMSRRTFTNCLLLYFDVPSSAFRIVWILWSFQKDNHGDYGLSHANLALTFSGILDEMLSNVTFQRCLHCGHCKQRGGLLSSYCFKKKQLNLKKYVKRVMRPPKHSKCHSNAECICYFTRFILSTKLDFELMHALTSEHQFTGF